MNVDHLVRMVNDIAAFFDAESDKNVAAQGVADHLRRFWEPRMRTAIVGHLRAGGVGLTNLSRAAVELIGEGSG